MEPRKNWKEVLGDEEAAASWSPVPDPRYAIPGTKMDWIQNLPFKSERGIEILPPETVDFYHDLHAEDS